MHMKHHIRLWTFQVLAVLAVLATAVVANAGTVLPGDLNCDGIVDFDDIDPFVLGMISPAAYEAQFGLSPDVKGDMDTDGDQDFDDIPCFVSTLNGEGCNPTGVPLPPAVWSGLVMLGLLGVYRTVRNSKSS